MKAASLVAVLALVPAVGFAQATATKPAPAKKSAAKADAGTKKAVSAHTTTGTVKSATDSSLVISKGGKDQTFVVNSTTEKKGTVETGAHVSVHYTMDGTNMVATAITASPAKKAAKTPKK